MQMKKINWFLSLCLLLLLSSYSHIDNSEDYDVIIIGAGSGGMGAAYALKGVGYKVAVIEQLPSLGGTACNSWIESWLPSLIPPYMEKIAIAMNKNYTECFLDTTWLDKKNSKFQKTKNLYLPAKRLSDQYLKDLLRDSVKVFTNHKFISAKAHDGIVTQITVFNQLSKKNKIFSAKYFVDASGDGVLCRSVNKIDGEDYFWGRDERNMFHESIAGNADSVAKYKRYLNEPSLCFGIKTGIDDSELLDACKTVFVDGEGKVIAPSYINSDGFNAGNGVVNPMSGCGKGNIGYWTMINRDSVQRSFENRVIEYWKYLKLNMLQLKPGKTFGSGKWTREDAKRGLTTEVARYLGIRETYRINCEYMLTQNDLVKLIDSDNLEDFIAESDHEIDFHVREGLNRKKMEEINRDSIKPYGIPYRCLIPKKMKNVLIASRCYGASQIALSSARGNFVMAQLGWAAGNALKICLDSVQNDLRQVNILLLQSDKYTDFFNRIKKLESLFNNTLKAEKTNGKK